MGQAEREKQRQCEWGRGRERISSRFHVVSAEPDMGLDPRNCEIMT